MARDLTEDRGGRAERREVLNFLRRQLIPSPLGEVEDHFNECLLTIIRDIERGKHRA